MTPSTASTTITITITTTTIVTIAVDGDPYGYYESWGASLGTAAHR